MPLKQALEHASSYTVGWIAALAHERAAALLLLDERHERPKDFIKNESDQNSYSWGRISEHNIVIASLAAGEYGIFSAAGTASGLRASLPHIRIGLLVGIGAGITGEHIGPDGRTQFKKEVLLGDVVVGIPDGTNGGVVQHDLYKAKGEAGGLERKGFLNAAPHALRSAVAALRAEHEIEDSQVETFLKVFTENQKTKTQYEYPGSAKDHLREYLQTRASSEVRTKAAIHYGTIISGNTLVKSAGDRDAILAWLKHENIDPLCLEMEAAGVMNSFPCIVIRGICDYADEHKNDGWQRYAAATAAAFAKELLAYVDPVEVGKERALGEVLDKIHLDVRQVKHDTTELRDIITSTERKEILSWLCPVEYAQTYDTYVKACVQDTGRWLLEHKDFQRWLSEGRVLYCPGSPGVGKTMLATRTLEYVYTTILGTRGVAVAYIYFDHARQGEQSLVHLLSCLLRQLSHAAERTPQCVLDLHNKHYRRNTRPSDLELAEALREVAQNEFTQTYMVIDALDECDLRTRLLLVPLLRSMAQNGNLRLMATSRLIPEIDDMFSEDVRVNISADERDISEYVCGRTAELKNRLELSDDLCERIVGTIVPAIHGMFLLARLHMDTLKSKTSSRDIADSLQSLPDNYNGAYEAAMMRINDQDEGHRRLANQVLMWIVCAKRPLLASELQHALAIRGGDEVLRVDGLIGVDLLVAVCTGLVVLRNDTLETKEGVKHGLSLHLAHYTTQEYFDRARSTRFPRADLEISRSCISYLTLSEFGSGPCKEDATLEDRLRRFPFLEYSAKTWGAHAAMIEEAGDDHALDALRVAVAPFINSDALSNAAIQVQALTDVRLPGYARRAPRASSACHLFARYRLRELCDYCHDVGKDVSATDSYGQPPLHYVMEACPGEAARTLKSWWRRTDLSKYGGSSVWYAVRYQEYQVLDALLSSGAVEPNFRFASKTSLIRAAGLGDTKAVQMLLSCPRTDLNAVDKRGCTALLNSIKSGHFDVAKMLLSLGGDRLHGAASILLRL